MTRKLTAKKLKQLYRLLSVRMTDFDCGKLCAPQNCGVPYCCDGQKVTPVLFRDEYHWHRQQGTFWVKMPVRTPAERKLVEESCSYNVFAVCPGVQGCRRPARSLACRLFPFEPFLDGMGSVRGLVYQNGDNGSCALMEKPQHLYNQIYIKNAIRAWQELVDTFPEDRELYLRESRKRTRHAARLHTSVCMFR